MYVNKSKRPRKKWLQIFNQVSSALCRVHIINLFINFLVNSTFILLFVVCNPPDPNDLNFSPTVDRIADQISIHFTTAGYGNTELLEFGKHLLDTQDQNNKSRLMSIIRSESDVKGKLLKLLKFWATKSGSVWENVIDALQRIGLGRLSDDLADELKSNQEFSTRGNFMCWCLYMRRLSVAHHAIR